MDIGKIITALRGRGQAAMDEGALRNAYNRYVAEARSTGERVMSFEEWKTRNAS